MGARWSHQTESRSCRKPKTLAAQGAGPSVDGNEAEHALSGGLRCVFSLGSLLRHAKHRSDLRPAAMSLTCRTDRCGQFFVHPIALFDQLGDSSQDLSVGNPEIGRINTISPFLQCLGPLRSCLAHLIHQPLRNFSRAFMAWMIAAPSSSVTTPTPNGSAVVDGPTNFVTAGSSVSYARQ